MRLSHDLSTGGSAFPVWRTRIAIAGVAVFAVSAVAGAVAADKPLRLNHLPAGLSPVPIPKDNPMTEEKIALGKQLYFDKRLSKDNTVSCATCHDPEKGYSNGEQFGIGVDGQKGGRNTPTVINSAYYRLQFWDGRAGTLEDQALGPIQNPIEMGEKLENVEKKLQAIPGYREQFRKVFNSDVKSKHIAAAIAAYERTVLSGDAPFDRYEAGDKSALSESAIRGKNLFFGRANCGACHTKPNFTDSGFHNVGVGMHLENPDIGREEVTKQEGDRGAFKTPTLREIARTAPYMHDGSMATLEEVVEYYDRGGTPNEWLDEEIFPLNLSAQDKADLVTFLKEGLSSESYPLDKAPELPK
jgi:cytochrome c peroxidase